MQSRPIAESGALEIREFEKLGSGPATRLTRAQASRCCVPWLLLRVPRPHRSTPVLEIGLDTSTAPRKIPSPKSTAYLFNRRAAIGFGSMVQPAPAQIPFRPGSERPGTRWGRPWRPAQRPALLRDEGLSPSLIRPAACPSTRPPTTRWRRPRTEVERGGALRHAGMKQLARRQPPRVYQNAVLYSAIVRWCIAIRCQKIAYMRQIEPEHRCCLVRASLV
jgi:hypothetical protein